MEGGKKVSLDIHSLKTFISQVPLVRKSLDDGIWQSEGAHQGKEKHETVGAPKVCPRLTMIGAPRAAGVQHM